MARAKIYSITLVLGAKRAAAIDSQGCFSHGYSAEICCGPNPAEGCWDSILYTREGCCERAFRNTTQEIRSYMLTVRVFDKLRITTECLVHSDVPDCESELLLYVARLRLGGKNSEAPSWIRSFWSRKGVGSGARNRAQALRLALSFSQVALQWRARALATQAPARFIYDPQIFVKLHNAAATRLRHLMNQFASSRWAQQLQARVDAWARGGETPNDWVGAALSHPAIASNFVHVAMVASVGQPPYAQKAMAGVRSALFFARERPVHFHFFVDAAGEAAMHAALSDIEPWLRAKGKFEMHGEDVINRFLLALKSKLPSGCLGLTKHFGDAGFLRLFVHELFEGRPDIEHVIWVDAGDYVFLEDPSDLLRRRELFSESHVAAGSSEEALPLQAFDLPRMRRAGWTQMVVDAAKRVIRGLGDCGNLGEGYVMKELSMSSHWYEFESAWCFEPHEYMIAGEGWKDDWDIASVWQERVYPGLLDWTNIVVHCPSFSETFFSLAYSGYLPTRTDRYRQAEYIAMHPRPNLGSGEVSLLEAGVFQGPKSTSLKCGQKVMGVHFIAGLKSVPWVREFLNFWAGKQVWGADTKDYLKRDLLKIG